MYQCTIARAPMMTCRHVTLSTSMPERPTHLLRGSMLCALAADCSFRSLLMKGWGACCLSYARVAQPTPRGMSGPPCSYRALEPATGSPRRDSRRHWPGEMCTRLRRSSETTHPMKPAGVQETGGGSRQRHHKDGVMWRCRIQRSARVSPARSTLRDTSPTPSGEDFRTPKLRSNHV